MNVCSLSFLTAPSQLGQEFVEHQDEWICGMAGFTAKAVVCQPCFGARHREAWMRYLVGSSFPLSLGSPVVDQDGNT